MSHRYDCRAVNEGATTWRAKLAFISRSRPSQLIDKRHSAGDEPGDVRRANACSPIRQRLEEAIKWVAKTFGLEHQATCRRIVEVGALIERVDPPNDHLPERLGPRRIVRAVPIGSDPASVCPRIRRRVSSGSWAYGHRSRCKLRQGRMAGT